MRKVQSRNTEVKTQVQDERWKPTASHGSCRFLAVTTGRSDQRILRGIEKGGPCEPYITLCSMHAPPNTAPQPSSVPTQSVPQYHSELLNQLPCPAYRLLLPLEPFPRSNAIPVVPAIEYDSPTPRFCKRCQHTTCIYNSRKNSVRNAGSAPPNME